VRRHKGHCAGLQKSRLLKLKEKVQEVIHLARAWVLGSRGRESLRVRLGCALRMTALLQGVGERQAGDYCELVVGLRAQFCTVLEVWGGWELGC
jgi:hypothetical protein